MPISRPQPGEYAPYYDTYFRQLPPDATDLLGLLRAQPAALRRLLGGLSDADATAPTAPGKWSVKQILTHLLDTERVFAYRALALARGEQQPLTGFEQDDYVAAADANARSLPELLTEHAAQRAATVALLAGLPEAAHTRTGTTAGTSGVSVRALAWVIAAHEIHHQRLLAALYPARG